MSVTEAERAVLRTALTEEIGQDPADILMRSTHPQGSDQLATKDDVTALATQIEGESAKTEGGFAKVAGEFAAVHAKMDGEFKAVDSGFEAVHHKMDGGFAKVDGGFEAVNAKVDGGFAKVDGEFKAVNAKMDGGFEAVHHKMDGGFKAANAKMDGGFQETRGRSESMMAAQTRTVVLWIAGMMLTTWVAMAIALVSLWLRLDQIAVTPPPTVPAAESPAAPPNDAGDATALTRVATAAPTDGNGEVCSTIMPTGRWTRPAPLSGNCART